MALRAYDRVSHSRYPNEVGTCVPVEAAASGKVRVQWDGYRNPNWEAEHSLVVIDTDLTFDQLRDEHYRREDARLRAKKFAA